MVVSKAGENSEPPKQILVFLLCNFQPGLVQTLGDVGFGNKGHKFILEGGLGVGWQDGNTRKDDLSIFSLKTAHYYSNIRLI